MNTTKFSQTVAKRERDTLQLDSIDQLACLRIAREDMIRNGFAYLSGDDLVLTDTQRLELELIRNYFDGLPLDIYDEESSRYRRHSKFYLLPFAGLLIPAAQQATYSQHAQFNSEAGMEERKFEPISDEVLSYELIVKLIKHDFENSPLDESFLAAPIEVGVHFIRLRAETDKPGVAVPNRLHKDGEPFTWIHLVNRNGVLGGKNIITDNSQTETLCETTLNNALDSIGIVDNRVWHQVKPVYVENGVTSGFRDVVLIDFTPMIARPNAPSSMAA